MVNGEERLIEDRKDGCYLVLQIWKGFRNEDDTVQLARALLYSNGLIVEEDGDKIYTHYVNMKGYDIDRLYMFVCSQGPREGISPAYWRWLPLKGNKEACKTLDTSEDGVYVLPTNSQPSPAASSSSDGKNVRTAVQVTRGNAQKPVTGRVVQDKNSQGERGHSPQSRESPCHE